MTFEIKMDYFEFWANRREHSYDLSGDRPKKDKVRISYSDEHARLLYLRRHRNYLGAFSYSLDGDVWFHTRRMKMSSNARMQK